MATDEIEFELVSSPLNEFEFVTSPLNEIDCVDAVLTVFDLVNSGVYVAPYLKMYKFGFAFENVYIVVVLTNHGTKIGLDTAQFPISVPVAMLIRTIFEEL